MRWRSQFTPAYAISALHLCSMKRPSGDEVAECFAWEPSFVRMTAEGPLALPYENSQAYQSFFQAFIDQAEPGGGDDLVLLVSQRLRAMQQIEQTGLQFPALSFSGPGS